MSQWSFAKEFGINFQEKVSDLERRLKSLNEPVSKLSLEVAKLAKDLRDATGSLPNRDQMTYESQLRSLEDLIEKQKASSAPKGRFTFKRKTASSTQQKTEPIPAEGPSSDTIPSSSIISGYSSRYLNSASISSFSSTDRAISNLDSCFLDLLDMSDMSALHVKNLKNCVLLLPIVPSSVILHDLVNCVIVVGAHQFRMHTSRNVDVYLSTSSEPVIEQCKGLRFAPYPSAFSSTSEEGYQSVRDFSHIKSTPSPNWSIMAAGDTITDWGREGLDDLTVFEALDRMCPHPRDEH